MHDTKKTQLEKTLIKLTQKNVTGLRILSQNLDREFSLRRLVTDLNRKPPVFLDTETTGLHPEEGAELLEIAILEADGTVILESFIKPTATAWPEAQAINGITPKMVQNAPTIDELSDDIIDALVGRDVHIWNASFDNKFIGFATEYATKIICDMEEFGNYIKKTQPINQSKSGRYKLALTAQDLGITVIGDPHRAKTDAQTMIKIRQTYTHQDFNRTDLTASVNQSGYAKSKQQKEMDKEFDAFIEFDSNKKTHVTTVSCKLFAQHWCALQNSQELKHENN
jgi:DNA polymerase III epsilon subunit-like protein